MVPALQHLGLIDDDDLVLDFAALEIAALDHSGDSTAEPLALLDRIEGDLRSQGDLFVRVPAQAARLTAVLGDAYGFDGDRDSYDAAENADLIRVLERRRGLPVALAILYAAAARRVGWSACVLDTPRHALVALHGREIIVLDPFNGGRPVPLSAVTGREAGPVRLEHLAPMTNRAALVRLLMNQVTRAAQQRDFQRALAVIDRVTTVAPAYSPGWWEQARLALAVSDRSAARDSLNAMLETTHDPVQRRQALQALKTL